MLVTDRSFHERGSGQFILVSVNYVGGIKTQWYAGEGGELVVIKPTILKPGSPSDTSTSTCIR